MKRILIAVSDPEERFRFAGALCHRSAVAVCGTAAELQAYLQSDRWDVLVLDLMLPGMDCVELCRMARSLQPQCRIAALANVADGNISDSLMGERIDYLALHPCNAEVFSMRVLELLGEEKTAVSTEAIAAGMLQSTGIPTGLRGYRYLREAIVLAAREGIRSPDVLFFDRLAAIWGSNRRQVEKSIRGAIGEAWERRDSTLWHLFFPPVPGCVPRKPTGSEFIGRMSGHLLAGTARNAAQGLRKG